MLKQPNDKQILALARLQNSPEFKEVINWFEVMLYEQDKDNRVITDVRLNQGQGVSQALAHIIDNSKGSKINGAKVQERVSQ